MAIINGREMNIPGSHIYGQDLINEVKPGPGRGSVIHKAGGFERIDPQRRYSKEELLDKKGRPVKISTIPDRSKGGFGGKRSNLSKGVITEQVFDVAEHLFKQGVDFDEDNADWLVVPQYRLPHNWIKIASTSPLLIVFPTEYPALPPIGFYLKADLPSPNGHLYGAAYHDAAPEPITKGWNWYCCYIQSGAWQPRAIRKAGDWKYGDNLWSYMTLVNEVLASKD